ncbi:alkaline phosphatase PafA [Cyclobacterium plantarum]|uniref:Alkaline phosphatase family protein n=1 Tax=Cyclobacterium plantarum TaxID=2716263 RepID=A0ABX0H4T0_9BACT|nr:alkaline phosphatase PafA [Cyclobacterium plantarum]NHE55324.1 alkaline phosphatase family protein [Cyclobacterium plantarum]
MKNLFVLAFLILSHSVFSQDSKSISQERPKLVIGIVVDQMRQEYFYRYQDRFVEGGFKRLMNEGFMMKNGHYNYIPTYTGPGHASVYTGTTPATHGIIGNDWYVRSLGRTIYCAEDSTVSGVAGSPSGGEISPRNLLSSTITDELMFATGKRSKVVGVAIKDRGAALPAGHLGDAYWYDAKTGEFMTSTYYYDELPDWAKAFNSRKLPEKYLSETWETLFPLESYVQGAPDNNEFESPFIGMETPTFPYDLAALKENNGGLGLISTTPYGNTLTLDLAYAALEGEQLGKRGETDFLAVSFSSTDYIGHRFGPSSVEVEDNYLRLDRGLADFFDHLDKEIGEGEYLVFLTADHGVADVVRYMQSERVAAGSLDTRFVLTQLRGFTNQHFGEGNWILNYSNEQVFLNRYLAEEKGLSFGELQKAVADFMLRFDGIKETYTGEDLRRLEYTKGRKSLLQMGFNHKASGDVMVILEPAWLSNSVRGTTHGTGYTYDTHVPIVFYGWGIKPGSSSRYATITDIAPTLSMLLHTRLPNGASGQPIGEVLDVE